MVLTQRGIEILLQAVSEDAQADGHVLLTAPGTPERAAELDDIARLQQYEADRCPCGGTPLWVPFDQARHLLSCTALEDFVRSMAPC